MFSAFLALLSITLAVYATPHIHQNRHHDIAKRHSPDVQLYKRFTSARWTYYDVGLGACGLVNIPSDFIVALNADQFGSGYPGPNCFKWITMTYNGVSAQAQITDRCPGCPYGGLDLSRDLFKHFGPQSAGVFYGEWTFNDGSGGGGHPAPSPSPSPSPPPPKPSPTPVWQPSPSPKPKPSTTSTTSTTTWKASTTTSHSTTSTTSTSSTSANSTSVAPAVPTDILSPSSPQNLESISFLLVQYGGLAVAAGCAQ